MYRVELKVLQGFSISLGKYVVPNVPCGVERKNLNLITSLHQKVPNVPCGVESHHRLSLAQKLISWFLMYRVELKVIFNSLVVFIVLMFLMYRVELKVVSSKM